MKYNHLLFFLHSTTEITPGKAVILLSDCEFNFKSNWNRLSSILSVPLELKGKMRAIIKEDETYEYVIEIALDWWIKNTSEASWEGLISSVDRCGEKDTAHAMRKKLSEKGNHQTWGKGGECGGWGIFLPKNSGGKMGVANPLIV